jgi:fermentation-respiration switch protein FrsA (DUF1100 family)
MRIVICLLVAYVAWCAVLFFWQDSMIFPRYGAAPPLAAPPFANTEIIRLAVDGGGQMEGWFIPASGRDASKPGPLVVYCHGNAETIDGQRWFVENYGRMGCSVFLPEYRGYGRSPGEPSEKAIVDDCVRFCDEVFKRPDVDRGRIAIHGRSLGGGVAAQIAARHKPAALILESTFTSVASFSQRYMVPEFLVRHPFRTDQVLRGLDVPILIIHGNRDTIVPVEHGRQLSRLAPKAVYVEYDCGHNDSPGPGNETNYWDSIQTLLVRSGVIRPSATGPSR